MICVQCKDCEHITQNILDRTKKTRNKCRHDLAENLALKQTWQKEQETGLEMCFQIFIFFKLTTVAVLRVRN